jgi:sugar phosphate isomerase/epimerase
MTSCDRRHFLVTVSSLPVLPTLAASPASATSGAITPRCPLGLLLYSYGLRVKAEPELANPEKFLEFAHSRGAAGVQIPLRQKTAAEAASIRRKAEQLGLYLEGIISPPKPTREETDRFSAELATAAACGATVLRMVLLGGRRYEVFTRAEEFSEFLQNARKALQTAEPLARKHNLRLGIENHKDFRTDELLDLLATISSQAIGVCVDLGNNLALVENPAKTIAALAPHAVTVHLKDIAVERTSEGFAMAEVPLGEGLIDLAEAVAVLRRAQPTIRLNLEMITRDPLQIPCLSERYWATMGKVPARELAQTLALVERRAVKTPLSRITALPQAEQLQREDDNVLRSFAYARKLWK